MMEFMSINVTSWNCYGLKKKKVFIEELCKNSEIIALQETLLWPHDANEIDTVHSNFKGFSKSAMDPTASIISGRPYGGLSFMWNKNIDKHVKIVNYRSNRLLGLQMEVNNTKTVFINVYLPWERRSNFDEYVQLLGEIASIMHDTIADHFCIIGDFNAHPTKHFYNELTQFCQTHSLTISDTTLLPQTSYTYIQHRLDSINTSWLDHCITSEMLHYHIVNCDIRYDLGITDDHLPLQIRFKLPPVAQPTPPPVQPPRINWKFNNAQKSSNYTSLSETHLRGVRQPANALLCNNHNCRNNQHCRDLSDFYSNIINALVNTGTEIFNLIRRNTKIVPGWNDVVKELHQQARGAFLWWRENGSPREGPIALLMRRARSHFKLALKQCRINEDQLRADGFSANLIANNQCQFWKGIQSVTPKVNKLAQRVGDAVGEENIAESWANHFESIFNCVDDQASRNIVNNLISNGNINEAEERMTPSDVHAVIKQLSSNKAQGCDGLPAEAYKFAHPVLHEMLAALYNSCIRHQFLPEEMLVVHLIPLIKNKLKDSSDPGNYRPIAIATISSKILESLLLSRLKEFLTTTDNQFGFKAHHSTDTCIYLLKEILNYYSSSLSPVFLCFVDVRKAFDRVNYHKLFIKLHERGTPVHLIAILRFWFESQKFCINWGGVLSRYFGSANGLRQGGILSPYLFNVYIDKLSSQLNSLQVGCTINNHTINNLCYADDMALLSPSAKGLQRLIDTCYDYASSHDIIFNETKTQCMSIIPRYLRHIDNPAITLGIHRLQFVNEFPYLGHIITNNLNDNTDIEHKRRKLCALGNMICRRFAFCNVDTKIVLFRAYFYSIYGSSLWSHYTQEQWRRIKVVHNDILRRLTHTPRFHSASTMFQECNLRTLNEIIRLSISSLVTRLSSSDNELIQSILNSDAKSNSTMWQHWERIAFV